MPFSVNGCGTSLLKASRKTQQSGGPITFDAVEAVTFLFCPLLPLKVLHVTSFHDRGYEADYHSIPLQFSWRIISKAFLRRWGVCLAFLGGFSTLLFGAAMLTMTRQLVQRDLEFGAIWLTMLGLGVIFVSIWRQLERSDSRIKRIIGWYELGNSDPYFWTDDTADQIHGKLLQHEPLPSLHRLAEQALGRGEYSRAMVLLRLGMRYNSEVDESLHLLQELIRLQKSKAVRPDDSPNPHTESHLFRSL